MAVERIARGKWLAAALMMAAALMSGSAAPQSGPEPLSAFPRSLLAVRTVEHKVINFKIWLADTPKRDQQGLMFVKNMDEHEGMLFTFEAHYQPTMWMKNTYIPLDILFMTADGRIDYIKFNATPLSLQVISPPREEFAVLELNGGAAERLGIHEGDMVIHSVFKNALPAATRPRKRP